MTDTPIGDQALSAIADAHVVEDHDDLYSVPPGDVDPTVVDEDAVEAPAPDWDDEDGDDEDVYAAPSEVVEDPLLTFLDTEDEDA